jgi:hypothetical protein
MSLFGYSEGMHFTSLSFEFCEKDERRIEKYRSEDDIKEVVKRYRLKSIKTREDGVQTLENSKMNIHLVIVWRKK